MKVNIVIVTHFFDKFIISTTFPILDGGRIGVEQFGI